MRAGVANTLVPGSAPSARRARALHGPPDGRSGDSRAGPDVDARRAADRGVAARRRHGPAGARGALAGRHGRAARAERTGGSAQTTWYLAVDQFGFLTFARDLLQGHVFHHWPPLDALAARLPQPVDVLVRSYVSDHGRLYCRYPPGYALLLAGWMGLFGDDAAHTLNPTIFVLLLVLLLALGVRIFRSPWRATAAVGLVVLFAGRTTLFLWGLTIVRDPATHLAALLGLYLLLPPGGRGLGAGRVAAAGLALGYAASVRPDAILYLLPAGLIAAARRRCEGRRSGGLGLLGVAFVAVTVGLVPLLAHDTLATGRPWRLTQGMEVESFFSTPDARPVPGVPGGPRVGYPPGAWRGGTISPVQGGGLKLENLRRVLPQNLAQLRTA
jgi:hypothetical protein